METQAHTKSDWDYYTSYLILKSAISLLNIDFEIPDKLHIIW
jgi:hypothetical protein